MAFQPGLAAGRVSTKAHAADRWAFAVMLILNHESDVRNLDSWGRAIGVSRGALRTWCAIARVSPKRSLDFARLLRSIVLSQGRSWDICNDLDIVDERTLHRMVQRGGITEMVKRGSPPTPDAFIANQKFIDNPRVLEAVKAHLITRDDDVDQSRRTA